MSAADSSAAAVRRTSPKAKKPKTMSIGVVLETLNQQFPDVTVSKIRFLESEGLISPQRTASGYRRFTQEDVDRLRYILTTQRDNYTPLKVIREQLEAMDSGQVTAIVSAGNAETLLSPQQFKAPVVTRLTDVEVATQASASEDDVASLVKYGLIRPDAAGFFNTDDVAIASAAVALKAFGFGARELKSLRNNARRQADLISQAAAPVAHSNSDTAHQKAEEISQQMTALVVSLHATLVKSDLRDEYHS
ncbi:MerR family transcriptional regulator [Corynebacterium tuberculostearicum]|uniref:transcriptional regulator FtsR n=1 Tax=Corynebacterium TaxID=1716 RepID=UPI001EF2B0E1|nr:MerR family transcriptional regulator [Corynebacterium tuberculostearicum]MCG7465013.1 MerR family transcriptional regulator [Corynebacterium sp. ACRPJ]WKE53892.1 MerR family transcriptional regulator [Corynebacterium tuberculostearicum]